jgi:hypothetical protein
MLRMVEPSLVVNGIWSATLSAVMAEGIQYSVSSSGAGLLLNTEH